MSKNVIVTLTKSERFVEQTTYRVQIKAVNKADARAQLIALRDDPENNMDDLKLERVGDRKIRDPLATKWSIDDVEVEDRTPRTKGLDQ